MTEKIIQRNQFIIQWSTNNVMDILTGNATIQLINPHKEGEFDYNSLQTLKVVLDRMGDLNNTTKSASPR